MGWVVNATPRPLYPWEIFRVSILLEAGWVPEPIWNGAENLVPTGISFLDPPTPNDSLYRLSYPGTKNHEKHIEKNVYSIGSKLSNFVNL
jgi:hypothetical protein